MRNEECVVSELQNKPSERGSKRVQYLDWLKLIAAWLVVFYHLSYNRLDYAFSQGEVYLPNLNRILMCFASCSVPVFFLVNGRLMFHRHRPWKEPVLKACKILALIVIWYPAHFPYWFFRTLIILYLLFPILQLLRERFPVLLRLLCLAVCVMPFGYNFLLMCLKGLALADVIPDWTGNVSSIQICSSQFGMALIRHSRPWVWGCWLSAYLCLCSISRILLDISSSVGRGRVCLRSMYSI